jgi:hypothetical protein
MDPDELLTYLEAELARCGDERDRLRAEVEAAKTERDRAVLESSRLDRMLLTAEHERDWLRGELLSVMASRSWSLTRPLRRLLGSDRPESADPL